MTNTTKKKFIARTIYHHKKKTNEHVTLLVYQDAHDAYELFDDREAEHDYLAGSEDYIFKEWGKRNRQLIEEDFQRDDLRGENKWQQFIT